MDGLGRAVDGIKDGVKNKTVCFQKVLLEPYGKCGFACVLAAAL
jgi:hypothetical protein